MSLPVPCDRLPSALRRPFNQAARPVVTLLMAACLVSGCRETNPPGSGSDPAVKRGVGNETASLPAAASSTEATPVNPVTAAGKQDTEPKEPATVDDETEPASSKADVHPAVENYTTAQLSKDHTLFVQAFDSVTRHTYFLSNYGYLMNDRQIEQTRDLVDSYAEKFTRLGQQRHETLQNASSDQDIQTLLLNNRVETLLLSRDVRRQIFRNILTREQRQAHQEEVRLRRETNQRRKQDGDGQPDSPQPTKTGPDKERPQVPRP
jgi:hypothetical protein